MQNLKLYCRVNGYERVGVSFVPEPPNFQPVLGRGEASNLDGIVRPIMRMLDVAEVPGSSVETDFEAPLDNMSTWCEAYKQQGWLPEKMKLRRDARGYEGCVTITLRESVYQPDRNSAVAEWLKVADWLTNIGHRVVIVRDTARADEPIDGYETFAQASRDLDVRVALYYVARMNLLRDNGPSGFLISTRDVPYLMTITPASVNMFESQHRGFKVANIGDFRPRGYGETDQWTAWLGFGKGEQVPWADTTRQHVEWVEDRYYKIRDLLERLTF